MRILVEQDALDPSKRTRVPVDHLEELKVLRRSKHPPIGPVCVDDRDGLVRVMIFDERKGAVTTPTDGISCINRICRNRRVRPNGSAFVRGKVVLADEPTAEREGQSSAIGGPVSREDGFLGLEELFMQTCCDVQDREAPRRARQETTIIGRETKSYGASIDELGGDKARSSPGARDNIDTGGA